MHHVWRRHLPRPQPERGARRRRLRRDRDELQQRSDRREQAHTQCTAHTVHLPLGALLIGCTMCGHRSPQEMHHLSTGFHIVQSTELLEPLEAPKRKLVRGGHML